MFRNLTKTLVKSGHFQDNYNSDLDIFLANALLLKGKIHDIQNNRFEARRAYKQCVKLKNQTAAMDFAKQYLNEPYKGQFVVISK